MDYSLAALKLFCGELKDVCAASASASSSAATLFGILFQRAWLQVRTIASPLSFLPVRSLSMTRRLQAGCFGVGHRWGALPSRWRLRRRRAPPLRRIPAPAVEDWSVKDNKSHLFWSLPLLLQSKPFPLFLAVSGMYVMVVGPYVAAQSGGLSTIRVPSLARTPY